jgi:D-hydroxyproline dehydrogenase subunit alpha
MTDPVVAVVGAGPAGLAASLAAAERGVQVVLLDNAAAPGGQILRQSAIAGQSAHRPAILRRVAANPRITLRSRTEVVHARVSPSGVDLLVRAREQLRTLTAGAVVLAPGASELALPFPGWDLPGVLTPGAAQAMLKAHAVRAGSRVVVAGTGPFLWPVAAGLVTAGAQVVALVEAASFSTVARRAGPLVTHGRIVAKTARYAATLARAGVPVLFGRAVVRAEGDDCLGRVVVGRTDQPGSAPQHVAIEADAACVGWGSCRRSSWPDRSDAPSDPMPPARTQSSTWTTTRQPAWRASSPPARSPASAGRH